MNFTQYVNNLFSTILNFIIISQKFIILALFILIVFFIAKRINRNIESNRISENLENQLIEEENSEACELINTSIEGVGTFDLKKFIEKLEEHKLKKKLTLENKERLYEKIIETKKQLSKIEKKRNPEEKKESSEEKKIQRRVVNIRVNEDDGLFEYEKLSKDEVEYLSEENYKEFEGYSLISKDKKKYLIRLRFNESLQHCFLVYDIKKYLEKFTNKVWLYQTKKPDVVFEIKNKKYAIEVETGKAMKYHRKLLLEKVKNLNKNYKKNWFFVLTNKKLTSKYNKIGPSCDRRTLKNRIDKIIKST